MKKIIAIILTVVMIASLLGGCKDSQNNTNNDANNSVNKDNNATKEKKPKDTITLLVQSEPNTLDPSYANQDSITIILDFICENLFTLGSDGKIYPELAESYENIDDTSVKIKLKEGVKFSDGTPLTSDSIMWAIKHCQESPVSQSMFSFVDLPNCEVVDDLNFVLKFKQAWAPYENTFATGRGCISSQAAFEKMGAEAFARSPIGTGPYKLVNWVSGTQIELTRNDDYWGEAPKTKNIVIKFIAEPTARVIELETGAADIAYYVEGTDIKRVEGIDGYHIVQGDSYRYFTVCLSMQEELFQDKRVREAMAYAIDKKALTEISSDGVGTPISGYCPSIMAGYTEMPEIPRDIEKAKKLMADAGYPDGFTIELHADPQPIFKKAAEALQSMWGEIGINVNIISNPFTTYAAQKNGKFQASVRDGTATELSNVLIIYESSFGSRMNGNDKWLDDKLLELRTYYYGDPKRDACIKEIMDHLYDIKFSYPYMVMPTVYGVSDKLEGFEFHSAEDFINPRNWVIYE